MRVFTTMGTMGATYRLTTTDTAAALASDKLCDPTSGRNMAACTLVCEIANVRIAVGADPTQGPTGVGVLLYPGDVVRIVGRENLEDLKYISASSGLAGALQVVPEY